MTIETSVSFDAATPAALSSFTDPDDVLSDPGLSLAERRAILADWASDARAVEGCPPLRQIECGAQIPVAEILAALKRLDAEERRAPRSIAGVIPLSLEQDIVLQASGPEASAKRAPARICFASIRAAVIRLEFRFQPSLQGRER